MLKDRGEGDSTFSVFRAASGAAGATLAVKRALADGADTRQLIDAPPADGARPRGWSMADSPFGRTSSDTKPGIGWSSGAPAIRYASCPDYDIAYQVIGDSPRCLLHIPGLMNNIESTWTEPVLARHIQRLASFARVIIYDKRGTGRSDPLPSGRVPTLEERTEEAVAVMDAAGVDRASVYATADGVPGALLLATLAPERVESLVLFAGTARIMEADDYPLGLNREMLDAVMEWEYATWGDESSPAMASLLVPSQLDEPGVLRSIGRMQQCAGTPRSARSYMEQFAETDARGVLDTIQVPVLLLHVEGDLLFPVSHGRFLAERVAESEFVELPGTDHLYWWQNADRIAAEIERFVVGTPAPPVDVDRVLSTVLFTDLVASTEQLIELGDRRWRDLLDTHDRVVREQIALHAGTEVNTTGDGFVAVFDGPARAARCGRDVVDRLAETGLKVRAGVHTGEIERRGDDVSGFAVHLAARIMGTADPGEVLVSRTVVELVAGSELRFSDRGEHSMKGIPGSWQLYTVVA